MTYYPNPGIRSVENSSFTDTEKITKEKFRELIRGLADQSQNMSLDEKFNVIDKAANESQIESRKYERRLALILEKMLEAREIKNWFPVPANSYLDHTLVDFVIVLNNNDLLPVQVTSKLKNVNKKIGRMDRIFQRVEGSKPPIALFSFLVHVTREMKTEDTIIQEIRNSFETTETIAGTAGVS